VLATLEDPNDDGDATDYDASKGCAFCGGLGHRVATCPKLEQHRMKQIMGNKNDDLVGSASRGMGGGGTDW
jgi:ATP-dependent RNA helicase DDX41